jgi:hypothetical protein
VGRLVEGCVAGTEEVAWGEGVGRDVPLWMTANAIAVAAMAAMIATTARIIREADRVESYGTSSTLSAEQGFRCRLKPGA